MTEFKIGDRVCRGPDWEWQSQGGEDPKGTVTMNNDAALDSEDNWAWVEWDNGERNTYRVGPYHFDLTHLREAEPWNATDDDMDDDSLQAEISEILDSVDLGEWVEVDPGTDVHSLVHQPTHYAKWEIEPITFIMRNRLSFEIGNIVKYAVRAGSKLYPDMDEVQSEITDLRKAQRYAEMRINQLEGKEVL